MIKDDLKFINFMKEREDVYFAIKSASTLLNILTEEQLKKLEDDSELQELIDLIYEVEANDDIISWDYLKMTLRDCPSITRKERDRVIDIHSGEITEENLREFAEILTKGAR